MNALIAIIGVIFWVGILLIMGMFGIMIFWLTVEMFIAFWQDMIINSLLFNA